MLRASCEKPSISPCFTNPKTFPALVFFKFFLGLNIEVTEVNGGKRLSFETDLFTARAMDKKLLNKVRKCAESLTR